MSGPVLEAIGVNVGCVFQNNSHWACLWVHIWEGQCISRRCHGVHILKCGCGFESILLKMQTYLGAYRWESGCIFDSIYGNAAMGSSSQCIVSIYIYSWVHIQEFGCVFESIYGNESSFQSVRLGIHIQGVHVWARMQFWVGVSWSPNRQRTALSWFVLESIYGWQSSSE